MPIRYQGQVEFEDSLGQKLYLRLGTYQIIEHDKKRKEIEGRERQFSLFHTGLINGAEEQKKMTFEDASEIADDIGYDKVNDLLMLTKWGLNLTKSANLEKKTQDRANAIASAVLAGKVEELRPKFNGDGGTAALDAVLAQLKTLQDKVDSANP